MIAAQSVCRAVIQCSSRTNQRKNQNNVFHFAKPPRLFCFWCVLHTHHPQEDRHLHLFDLYMRHILLCIYVVKPSN
jgi:hypothetical protein